jgi:hypothetical protein
MRNGEINGEIKLLIGINVISDGYTVSIELTNCYTNSIPNGCRGHGRLRRRRGPATRGMAIKTNCQKL